MSDQDSLLKAAQRERRRIIFAFSVVLAVTVGTLGTGWWTAWNGRDAWHEQSVTWQDRYIELYDEFTTATGEEPDAPDPEDVADSSPEPVTGSPGPVGPTGPAGPPGRSPSGAQVADAVSVFCAPSACLGPSGKDGARGADGTNGRDGSPGTDSTTPGPQGPQGVPGPQGEPGRDGSPGTSGAPGADGAPGKDGRGIQTLQCDEAGIWQVVYTDGTTATAGVCRITEEE